MLLFFTLTPLSRRGTPGLKFFLRNCSGHYIDNYSSSDCLDTKSQGWNCSSQLCFLIRHLLGVCLYMVVPSECSLR
ncbi:hypothetical protein E2542_SST28013 [Spatholobus suberectus]|nr:hypothetical protein E2542_SST28013 [Spatholobus suberectus]